MNHLKAPSFLLLVCLLGFPQISETIYTPSLPDIAHYFAASAGLIELTLSIFFIGFAVGVFVWGILADKMGRRQAILYGLIIYTIGSLLCSFAPSVYWLLTFRFIQAFGSSVGSVVTQTIIRDIYEGKERHRLFSSLGAPLAASPAIGPFIGGYIDQFFGWNYNFLVLVFIGLILWTYCYSVLWETASTGQRELTLRNFKLVTKKMCKDLKILGFVLLIGGCNGILFSFYAEGPFLFIEHLGLSPGSYGILGVAVASSVFFASLLSRYLNKLWEAKSIILLGCIVLWLGSLILSCFAGIGFVTPQLGSWGLIAVLAPLAVIFLGIGLIIPNSLSLALADYQDYRGTAGSLFGLTYYILIAFLTAGMGIIHTGSILPMPLYFVAIASIMFGGLFLTLKSQKCQVKIA